MSKRVGFIGLGMMGSAMAERLQDHSYHLVVHTRTRGHAESVLQRGAEWLESPRHVAGSASIVFSMLSTSEVLEEVAVGQSGILAGCSKGSLHVDCSTVSPAVTKHLAERYREKGCHFVHCPVLGSVPQAREGSLLLFAGGPSEALAILEPFLPVLGKRSWKFDSADQASSTKLVCNLFIAGMIVTLGQGLLLAGRSGVDQKTILDILSESALNTPMYQGKGASILAENFTPRFFAEHMLKDVNLMLDAAASVGAVLPAIETARTLYEKAVQLGMGKEDYSVVWKVLADLRPADT